MNLLDRLHRPRVGPPPIVLATALVAAPHYTDIPVGAPDTVVEWRRGRRDRRAEANLIGPPNLSILDLDTNPGSVAEPSAKAGEANRLGSSSEGRGCDSGLRRAPPEGVEPSL